MNKKLKWFIDHKVDDEAYKKETLDRIHYRMYQGKMPQWRSFFWGWRAMWRMAGWRGFIIYPWNYHVISTIVKDSEKTRDK